MKPAIVGMNQPQPEVEALWPYPPGCAGHRLWQMLAERTGATAEQYLAAFDRFNVLDARDWDARRARASAEELWVKLAGRQLVVLGGAPLVTLGLRRPPGYGVWTDGPRGTTYCHLPHPSGRCREYNDAGMRLLAGSVLAQLYRQQEENNADIHPVGRTGR